MRPQLITDKPFQRFGRHPYVSYRAGPDRHGRWWIQCHCSQCGDSWQKLCMQPARTNMNVSRYAVIHSHGLRPVM